MSILDKHSSPYISYADTGEGLHLVCKSYGTPMWYFKVVSDDLHVILIGKTGHLFIYPVQRYMNGIYYCYGYSHTLKPFILEQTVIVFGN